MKKLVIAIMVSLGIGFASNAQAPTKIKNQPIPSDLVSDSSAQADTIPDRTYTIQMAARSYADSIVLRLATDDPGVWLLGNHYGWTITRIGGTRITDTEDSSTTVVLNNGQPFKPWTLEQFKQNFDSTNIEAGVVAQMLYGATTVTQSTANDESTFFDYVFRQSQEQEQRQLVTYMVAERNARVAEAAGLRYVDRDIEKGEEYSYIITPNIDREFIDIRGKMVIIKAKPFVRTADLQIPEIKVDQIDPYRAAVHWGKNNLSGYFIERSTDGKKWERLTNSPIFGSDPDEAIRKVYGDDVYEFMKDDVVFVDSLELNTKYIYRVKAFDAFAEYTEWKMGSYFEMVDIIPPAAPVIVNVVPKDNKSCTIMWVKDTIESDLKGYLLTFAYHADGPWMKASELISPKDNKYIDPDAGERGPGYYRLFAVDYSENVSFSNSTANNIADLVAPPAPKNVHGEGDFIYDTIHTANGDSLGLSSNGLIYLQWDPVDANDLLGYRVFYANQRDHEYIEASHEPTTDLYFFDTINANTITPYIYYYVIAVDQRYNYSVPSDTVAIRTPDIVPPGVCVLLDMHQTSDSVYISWTKSTSEDVDQYIIYRRPKGSNRWIYLRSIPSKNLKDKDQIDFSDCPPAVGRAFQYCIEALDSSQLSSGRFGYVNVYSGNLRSAQVKMELSAKREKGTGHVELAWKYNYKGDLEHYGVIYRSIDGNDFTAIGSFKEGDSRYVDTSLPSDSSAQYYIVLKLGNGCTSNASNTAKVK